ncbi:hypothetical protein [Rhodococcus erythropolis]|uniref:Uncharacterized protein n=1 Tax=Rhodococcus erythropolis TaxID=1833 RepID=A0A8I1A1C9_RHOER|nr:hypothetical protein [Rhodococcus erythropolis]MBH5146323.1 hypothetical protein [Rhodococcus erythropolis]
MTGVDVEQLDLLPPAKVPKVTERDMLDLLNGRYHKDYANGPRYVGAEHVRSHAGFGAQRTADYMAMDLWPGVPYGSKIALHGHEVKVSRSDWLTELKTPEKAEEFKRYMDYWWLVVSDPAIVKPGELPEGWGLMIKSGNAIRVKKAAPKLDPLPMPKPLMACLLRAVSKTAKRGVA